MRVPINITDSLTTGTYDFEFTNVANFSSIPALALPLDFSVLGKHITAVEQGTDVTARTFHIVVQINENPIPAGAIVLGILVILGLSLTFMSLNKIEKIVDSPAADVGIVAVAIGIIALVFHFSGFKS